MDNSASRPVASAPDLETIMQRIRETVKQRSQPESTASAPAEQRDVFGQLESVLLEQSGASDSVFDALAQGLAEMQELQTEAQRFIEAQTQDVARASEEIGELREQIEQSASAIAANAGELESLTSRVYQFEPRVDAELAKLGITLRQSIADGLAEVRQQTASVDEQLRQLEPRVDAELAKLGNTLGQSIADGLAEVRQQTASLDEQLRQLEARVDAELAKLGNTLGQSIADGLAEVRQQTASLDEQLRQLAEAIDGRIAAAVQQQATELRAQTDTVAAELGGTLEQLKTMLQDRVTLLEQRVHEFQTAGEEMVGAAGARLLEFENDLAALRRDLEGAKEVERNAPPAAASAALSYTAPTAQFDYFKFEQRWRGTVDDITQRQGRYVELFSGRQRVVDLGCGRGEFVQLLMNAGIGVHGIDGHPDMVRFCHERGLPVTQSAVLDYLRSVADGSLDGITLFQVIEHLTPDQLIQLVALCAQKLEPGGIFLAETINPNCLLALSNFYLDPTHVRPWPAATLVFIAQQHGLDLSFIRYTAPVPGSSAVEPLDVHDGPPIDVSDYQDYAMIAHRRGSTTPANATETTSAG